MDQSFLKIKNSKPGSCSNRLQQNRSKETEILTEKILKLLRYSNEKGKKNVSNLYGDPQKKFKNDPHRKSKITANNL